MPRRARKRQFQPRNMEYEGLTKYAEELNMSKTKIAFFSSTP